MWFTLAPLNSGLMPQKKLLSRANRLHDVSNHSEMFAYSTCPSIRQKRAGPNASFRAVGPHSETEPTTQAF